MRVLFSITHPAHVHFFRGAMEELRQHGHEIVVASREKDLTTELLDRLEWPHTVLSRMRTGTGGLALELAIHSLGLARILRRRRPDLIVAIQGTFVSPVARLFGIPTIGFTDTEHARIGNAIAFRCLRHIVTPSCFRFEIGPKQYRYDGYHELAYLHPNRFTPDPRVWEALGVAPGERFAIVRFVSWASSHDVGHRGITLANKRRAVAEFSRRARVFITSESPLPEDLAQFRLPIPPQEIHHALAFASLLYGESATMASEAAVLGTPAIFLDDVGRGYTDEEERRYGLVFNYTESAADQDRSIAKGIELLEAEGAKETWKARRERLLSERIDVTRLITRLVEEYPRPFEAARDGRRLSA